MGRCVMKHIMNKCTKIAKFRHYWPRFGLPPPDRAPIALGHPQADAVLGGDLRPGAQHEVFAGVWSPSGFAVLLALLSARKKPFFWMRPGYEALAEADPFNSFGFDRRERLWAVPRLPDYEALPLFAHEGNRAIKLSCDFH